MLLVGVFYHGAPVTTEAWQIIAADPALNLKEKLKGLRTNWALRTGQGLTQDDNKDELVKVRERERESRRILHETTRLLFFFCYLRTCARAATKIKNKALHSADSNYTFLFFLLLLLLLPLIFLLLSVFLHRRRTSSRV